MSDSFSTSGNSPGPHFSCPAAFVPPAPSVRVGLVGYGTVGSAVARRLLRESVSGLHLTHIVDRRAEQKRRTLDADVRWSSNFDDLLTSDVDIVVELVGGIEPGAAWIRSALLAGKSVVTANKQVIASHGADLLGLAARQGRQLRFEASVGGAIPIVRAIGGGLAGECITAVAAILNGTCNAILSRIESTACTFAQALEDAQARGYAEADPSADLDGHDAAAKLSILSALGFGVRVDPARITTRSIAGLTANDVRRARRHDATIRQIAFAAYNRRRSTLRAWVAPALVPLDSIFARTTGPQNAALLTGRYSGQIGIFGTGAGGDATAVAIVADLLAIARDPSAVTRPPRLTVPDLINGLDPEAGIVDLTALAVPNYAEAV